MSGEKLFEMYRKGRDHSGSEADRYAQELFTYFMHCSANGQSAGFFALLKKAHDSGKKVVCIEDESEAYILKDEYYLEDLSIE